MRTRDLALLSGVALGLQFSCRTSPPHENHSPASVDGAGGRGSVGASGGAFEATGGSASPLGGEGGELGVGGDSASGGTGGTGGPGPGAGGRSSSSSGGSGPDGTGGTDGSGGSTNSLSCPQPVAIQGEFSRAVLRESAAACAEWVHCRFEEASAALVESAQDLDGSAEALALAQEDWRHAMGTWAIADAMQFGPVASASESQGRDIYLGRGIRDIIYSWPQMTRCRVEEQVVNKRYQVPGFQSVSITGRGLFGLEFLFYYPGADISCSSTSAAYELWSTKTPSELRDLKNEYAGALAGDIHERALELKNVWAPDGDDFAAKFTRAEGYPSEQEAMNVLGWALLYVEREVKDWKLGVPAGYTSTSPVLGPEAAYANLQTEILRANLNGFRLILEGCSEGFTGVGFDDWLIAAGHGELSTDLLAATRAAESTFAALPPFSQATPEQLDGAYVAIKALTDLLKGDLFGAGSPLNLKLPSTVEGDTD